MKIEGKMIRMTNGEVHKERALIELDKVDIPKIKEGDEIWIKTKVYALDFIGGIKFHKEDIVAHFPKPEEKFCRCPNRRITYGGTLTQEQIDKLPCDYCNKPLQEQPKELPEEIKIEDLDFQHTGLKGQDLLKRGLATVIDNQNQILRYLKDKK